MEQTVFNREPSYNDKIISDAMFNFVLGITLFWGFLVNWVMVISIDPSIINSINPFVFMIGYLVSCFLGVWLFKSSDNPLVSFIGYNFIVVPFGFIINIAVSRYNPSIVADAIRITGIVTVVMMILGSLFPLFFKKIAGALSVALLVVIVVELVEVYIFHIHHNIIDWIVVLIFCGYIGYDWGRANQIPKTIDNAIDSAAALYIDIINLFIRVLRIFGRR